MKIAIGLIFAWTVLFKTAASDWDYVGASGIGHWAELFPTGCSGTHQSPIDIVSKDTVYDPSLKEFNLFYDPPKEGSQFLLYNNGHSIQVDTKGDFFVANGGLKHLYKTLQFHFHWGLKGHHGSEHTVDEHASPIEMHIVNYDTDTYGSVSEAVTKENGLAVLGILFEISDEDNPVLEPIINAVVDVRDPDLDKKIEIPAVSLKEFLPSHPEKYYRYSGSLTTPGCFESVIWTVFKEKQTISKNQLIVFRQALKSAHHRRRRSTRREDRAVLSVLQELGIEDNSWEKRRFKRTLEEDHTSDLDIDNTLHDEDQEEAIEEDDHEDDPVAHAEDAHENDHDEHNERHHLVNNFRPVQPLNDREVFRSFPSFEEDSIPAPEKIWHSQQQKVRELVTELCPILQYYNQCYNK